MKKSFLMVAALAAFAFTSCNSDDDIQGVVNNGEMEEVTLTVGVDNGVQTKAPTTTPATYSSHKVRYIVEVWNGNTRFVRKEQITNQFNLSVPKGATYTLAVWVDYIADNTTEDGSGFYSDKYYATNAANAAKGLKEIKQVNVANETWNAAQDAYSANVTWSDSSRPTSITATRPFARLNVKALDQNIWNTLGIDTNKNFKITTTFTGVPTTFNATDGSVDSETSNNVVSLQSTPSSGSGSYTYAANGDIFYSGFIFASSTSTLKSVKLVLEMETSEANKYAPTYDITNVPIQRNYQTNIIGNLIVGTTSFTIYVEEGYNTPDNNIDQYGRKVDAAGVLLPQYHATTNTLVVGSQALQKAADLLGSNKGTTLIVSGTLDNADLTAITNFFNTTTGTYTLDLSQAIYTDGSSIITTAGFAEDPAGSGSKIFKKTIG